VAETVLPGVGTYYLLLTVHDGCAISTRNLTIQAVCSGTTKSPNFNNRTTVSSNGRNYITLDLENVAKEKDGSNQFACDTVTDWSFYNFTENSPTGVNVAPASPSPLPPSASLFEAFDRLFHSIF